MKKNVVLFSAIVFSGHCIAASENDLASMNLEQLMDMSVTTVSKRTQSFTTAAAAIFTITQEDIRRSGVTSVPEVLKLVPGLEVSRNNATSWAVSARGFSSQFARKLLVMIDGRSIYTPLFSGVFWDQHIPSLDDIQRIEVIRGPGASLWGSNAVNGVINIITYDSEQTQGEKIVVGAGNEEKRFIRAREGFQGETFSGRVNVQHRAVDDSVFFGDGADARDDFDASQMGLRLDFRPSIQQKGTFDTGYTKTRRALQIDIPVDLRPLATATESLGSEAGYVLFNWVSELGNGDALFLQTYHDITKRVDSLYRTDITTTDYELQYNHKAGAHHRVTWGLNHRDIVDDLNGSFIIFAPQQTDYYETSTAFLQDEYKVSETLTTTVGLKLEDGDLDRLQPQPTLRATWQASNSATLWAAASRASRTPSRVQKTLELRSGATDPVPALVDQVYPGKTAYILIEGSDDFHSEVVHAYEIGGRFQLYEALLIDASTYVNYYKDFLSYTIDPVLRPDPDYPDYVALVLISGNGSEGKATGFELASDYLASDVWRLKLAYNYFNFDSTKNPYLMGASQPAQDFELQSPQHQLNLVSRHTLQNEWEFDWAIRYVDEKFNGLIPAYTDLSLRLAKVLTPALTVSLVGKDLVDTPRVEFYQGNYGPPLTEIQRSVFLQVEWRNEI